MLAELRDFLLLTDAGWWLGTGLIIAGIVALAVFAWRNLGDVQAVPRKLADPPPRWAPQHRTRVVPRIPGATPQAGPVCPVCGGPWHALCPSAPKERSDETVEIPIATEPALSPTKPLAPEFVALSRFFSAVDEARADTEAEMRRLAANARPDCPLTTHELEIPTVGETPVHRAIADREPTQELSKTVAKILEAQR